jgi:hypothetical protein
MNAILLAFLLAAAPAPDELAARAAAIKPSDHELTWLHVPWVLDLAEAQQSAQAENRPILVWATGDDPLERC